MVSISSLLYRGDLPLLDVWKNALQLFVWNKHFISKKHEFAIVILNEKAQWVRAQLVRGRQVSGKVKVVSHVTLTGWGESGLCKLSCRRCTLNNHQVSFYMYM